jgi:hypothetical protein
LENLKKLGVETLAQLVFESHALYLVFEMRVNRLIVQTVSLVAIETVYTKTYKEKLVILDRPYQNWYNK